MGGGVDGDVPTGTGLSIVRALVRDELGTFLTGDEATWAAARYAASQRNRRYNDDLRRQSDATRRRLAEDSE